MGVAAVAEPVADPAMTLRTRRASVPRDHSANASVPRHGQPNVARFQVQVALREGDLDPVLVELTLDHHPLFVLQAIGTGPFAAVELRLSRLTSVGSPAFALVPLHCPLLDYVVACNCVRDAVWDAVDRCVNARCAKFLKW